MLLPFRILVLSLLVPPPPLLLPPQTLVAVVVAVVVVAAEVAVVIAAVDLTAVYQDSLGSLSAGNVEYVFLSAVAGVVHLFVLVARGTSPIEVGSPLLHRS